MQYWHKLQIIRKRKSNNELYRVYWQKRHLHVHKCFPPPKKKSPLFSAMHRWQTTDALTSNTCRQTGCGEFKWTKTKKNLTDMQVVLLPRSPQIIQFFNVSMFSMYAICPVSIHIYFTCTLTIHSVHLFNTTLVPMYCPMYYTCFTYALTNFSPFFPVLYLLHRYLNYMQSILVDVFFLGCHMYIWYIM